MCYCVSKKKSDRTPLKELQQFLASAACSLYVTTTSRTPHISGLWVRNKNHPSLAELKKKYIQSRQAV